ncbi:MAG: lipid-A-disaccharide synthase [Phycisphaerae bacterium]|nr:lipid-A-disaccharide synthase [Phycisphaerae bacterium]
MSERPVIFLSAAEASGDHHAAVLISALKRRLPDARFVGAAGPEMAAAGCEVIIDLTKQASMLGGPFLKILYYRRAVKKLQQAIKDIRPDIHVPVDSPALNWHLCKAAKAAGVAVMYYVAPQVWAWAPWRIKKVRRLTDHVACLLPFEEEYFRSRGVAATYVGHPLFDQLPAQPAAANCPDLAEAWLDGNWRVAILPGSRPGEISKLAPAMAATAEAIRQRWPDAKCTFTAINEAAAGQIRAAAGSDVDIAVGRTAEVLAESHFAVVASGTVTLEVAHFGVPMVIAYNVGIWQKVIYNLVARHLIRTRQLSLVNILAGRKIVPELMPWFAGVQELADTVIREMDDYGSLHATREKLLKLTAPLAVPPPGSASDNVADIITGMLKKK